MKKNQTNLNNYPETKEGKPEFEVPEAKELTEILSIEMGIEQSFNKKVQKKQ